MLSRKTNKMTVYPYSHLFISSDFSVVVSGPHIQVLHSANGRVLFSTLDHPPAVVNAGPIKCAAVDSKWTYLATCADDKLLNVWLIDGLKLLNRRVLPKKPTNIVFTKDSQTILVSDKFGDVFSYTLEYTPTEKQKCDASLSSHENPSEGKLILGHVSVLTTFLLSQDEGYIITADRDEHIRVSWYPQGFVIEMYCLGHQKYVSALHIPSSMPSTLVSGGGDPMLKVWDWKAGTVQYEIPILDTVRPFIVVLPKPKRSGEEEDEESRKKGKTKGESRNKGKGKAVEEDDVDTSDLAEDDDAHGQPRQVFVVHRIASIEHKGDHHLVFSAVGATALFTCPLKPESTIRSFELGIPVLDFTVHGDKTFWVLLDGNWAVPHRKAGQESPTRMVRVLYLTAEGELVEVASGQLGPHSVLLTSLNTTSLLPATVDDLKKLEFYTDLTWLPKHNEGINFDPTSEIPVLPEVDADKDQGKQMTKRELARLKNKRKVEAKAQETTRLDKLSEETNEEKGKVDPVSKKHKSDGQSLMEVDSQEH